MAAYDIKGRDAFSATSGTGGIDFAALDFGPGPGSNALSLSTPVLVVAALAAALVLYAMFRR